LNVAWIEPGNGLGLSGAKKHIEEIGGSINLFSTKNVGTELLISLPDISSPSWFPANIILQPKAPVIILEDDESMCAFWLEHLKPYGVGVEIFTFTQADAFLEWHLDNPESLTKA
jgi:hypothetical protein